jgi:PAS domain S-box-containing protein
VNLCADPSCLAAFRTIIGDIECPVFVADGSGRYVVANHAFCELLGAPASRVLGSRISDWFGSEVAAERRALREHVLRTGRAVHVTDMLRGRRYTGVVRPFEAPPLTGCILVTLQPRPPMEDERRAGLYPLKHHDLGPLSGLTKREMEILELIGQGLTQREIGARLGRTVKTIEAHRAALGRKLGARKNVNLVQIAMAAGMLDPARSLR